MTSRGCGHAPLVSVRLVDWAWFWLWLLLAVASGAAAAAAATEGAPRAVLVSLADEHELLPILSSVSQLEDTFNGRYRYDWVFFSTRPLSDEFRRLTSNATKATCMYEVIDDDGSLLPPAEGARGAAGAEAASPVARIRRWKSGPFAKEKRLRGYDWFWRIEPGAQFVHDMDFDVFRVMRDCGIAYGSNKANVDEGHKRTLSQHVRGFMDKNPELVHAEADVSWLLGSADQGEDAAERDEDRHGDQAGSPAEAFASWLGGVFKSSVSPAFEIGSLALLRSQSHEALLAQVDSAGDHDLYPTLSASIFLPQKSVLHFGTREKRRASGGAPPESTPNPKLHLVWTIAGRAKAPAPGDDDMATRLARWELLARDMHRQGGMPGLRSGNTVIDERNFALDKSKPQPWASEGAAGRTD